MLKSKNAKKIAVCGLLLWLGLGFAPMLKYGFGSERAAFYGDSFGFVNSLFSGIAFLSATYALILQIEQSHDSRAMQNKQAELQATQMELAKQTAQIQELTRLDGRREVAMNAFLQISLDLRRYVTAFYDWHPEIRQRTLQARPDHFVVIQGNYADAMDRVKSNILRIDLIFGESGKLLKNAISDFLTVAMRWAREVPPEKGAIESQAMLSHSVGEIEKLMSPLWRQLNFDGRADSPADPRGPGVS